MPDKPTVDLEVEVEVNGQELEIELSNPEDVEADLETELLEIETEVEVEIEGTHVDAEVEVEVDVEGLQGGELGERDTAAETESEHSGDSDVTSPHPPQQLPHSKSGEELRQPRGESHPVPQGEQTASHRPRTRTQSDRTSAFIVEGNLDVDG